MKKFEYAQVMRNNYKGWREAGLINFWGVKKTDVVGSLEFANRLGRNGWEMYDVTSYGMYSVYFFKREIS